jgi:phage head maturation protease
MTLEHGISRENPDGNKTFQYMQKGSNLQLVAEFTISGDREIYGVAHVPTIDRENELILSEAIRNALPEYMKLPILHVQHTERPVGTVTKALVDDQGKLHVWGKIKATPDTDDVWEDISAGNLNKFSIFGKRLKGTPECSLHPTLRTSPCVSKAMTLFSISVVGDNAMNEETFLRVAKAYGSGSMEEEDKKKEDKEEEVEKSDEMTNVPELAKSEANISSVLERLGKVEGILSQLVESDKQVHSEMGKAEDEDEEKDTMEEKKKEDETVEKCNDTPVKKADEVEVKVDSEVKPDIITKADLVGYITKADFDVITKAYDDLKSRVEKMEKETIEKGGNVVIIQTPDYSKDNPMLGNADAVGV